MKIKYTNEWLDEYAHDECMKLFHQVMHCPISWRTNMRRTTGGEFTYRYRPLTDFARSVQLDMQADPYDHKFAYYSIGINPRVVKAYPKLLHGIVGHELCHYVCFVHNKPCGDGTKSFTRSLQKYHLPVNMPNLKKLTPKARNPKRLVYECPVCHHLEVTKTLYLAAFFCPKCLKKFYHQHPKTRRNQQAIEQHVPVCNLSGTVRLQGDYQGESKIDKVIVKKFRKFRQNNEVDNATVIKLTGSQN